MTGQVKFKDSTWKAILRFAESQSKPAQESHVKVGVVGPGANESVEGMTMVELAAIHEFGAPRAGIPERSFIRRTFAAKQEETGRVTALLAKRLLAGEFTLEKALNVLGMWASTAVKKTITEGDGIPPPLAPATVAAKGSSRPLVDTGRLLQSISWQVWLGRARDAKGRFVKGLR